MRYMNTTKKIEVENTFSRIRIKINDIIHLSLPQGEIKVQTWLIPHKHYYAIEYYTIDGEILCEYDSRDIWENILKELENKKVI